MAITVDLVNTSIFRQLQNQHTEKIFFEQQDLLHKEFFGPNILRSEKKMSHGISFLSLIVHFPLHL